MEVWRKVGKIVSDVTCNSVWRVYMLWIASAEHIWCVEYLITMSWGASVLLACFVSLLWFFYKFREFWGKLTLMMSLHSHEFWYGKFVLVKSSIDVPCPLWMPELSRCCIMGSPFNRGRGLRSSRSARPEPQRAWDYFLLASHVPESPTRGAGLGMEMVSSFLMNIGVEEDTSNRVMTGTVFSQESKPWGRGRPKKGTKKGKEDRLPTDLGVRSVIEEPMRFTHWSVPVGTTGRGGRRGKGGERASGSPDDSSSQQLEWDKLMIDELYQENRDLQCQLVVKDQEIPSSLGHVGSTVWLQRQLREAQDTIVQLHEVQRMMGEKNTVQGISSNLGKGIVGDLVPCTSPG
jgi:hypothetical protein